MTTNKVILIDKPTSARLGEIGAATRYPKSVALHKLAEVFGESWLKEKLRDQPFDGASVCSLGRISQWASQDCHAAVAELSDKSRYTMGIVVRHLVHHYGEEFEKRFGGGGVMGRDLLGDAGTPGPWRGGLVTRDALRDVARLIANRQQRGILSYQLHDLAVKRGWASFPTTVTFTDCALKLLKEWGLIEFRRPDGGGPKAWHWIGEEEA